MKIRFTLTLSKASAKALKAEVDPHTADAVKNLLVEQLREYINEVRDDHDDGTDDDEDEDDDE